MTKPDKDATIKRLRAQKKYLEKRLDVVLGELDQALAGKEAAEQALRDERRAEQARMASRSYGNHLRA